MGPPLPERLDHLWISDGAPHFSNIAVGFRDLERGYLAGVPVLTLSAIGAAIFVAFVLDHTELGRRIMAIGGNRQAARLTGVRIVPSADGRVRMATRHAYERIAAEISREFIRGLWQDGNPLPSVTLARAFRVSRRTARQALELLRRHRFIPKAWTDFLQI